MIHNSNRNTQINRTMKNKKSEDRVIAIVNGGNPLPGCPEDWGKAQAWETTANEDLEEFMEPQWKFDCGFKLDFDGPLVSVSSRFYPPKSHYGEKWDGTVTIRVLTDEVLHAEFECDTLDELKDQVESFVKDWVKEHIHC